jgi:large subunit ribosomal protein L25
MDLAAQDRATFGKSLKTLRQEGLIPAEFYGHGLKNAHLAVRREEFKKAFKVAGENTVIQLLIDSKKQPALIYDVQEDRLSGEVVHVDFYGVRMDEKIKAHIPVEFTGESPAVKEQGGVVNKALVEIEVEALPGDLPHDFTVDISSLKNIDDSIYVKDLAVSKGVKVLIGPDSVIVSIAAPRKEEEIVAPPAEAAVVAEVKVETEEKKAERAAEQAAEKNETPS